MSSFSNYLETQIVEVYMRNGTLSQPTSIYVALFTADPSDANTTSNEVQVSGTWTDYTREDAADGGGIATGWVASSNGVTSNAKVVTFPPNDGASITITHLGLYDASTAGNLLFHAPLTAPKTLLTGDVLSFAVGSIVVTVA